MLFPLLLAGHLLGDWVVQTDWQAATKAWTLGDYRAGRRYWTSIMANQAHCLTYHLTMAFIVVPFWHTRATVAAFVISWVSHGFIDRRWPVRWLLRNTGSPAFAEQLWGVIAADQALHLFILALIAAAAS
jgi:hypothetical protein